MERRWIRERQLPRARGRTRGPYRHLERARAPGCNIANFFSGVARLSLHSFLAGAGIVLGGYVVTHDLYREVGCAI